ncbi:MAG TPA: hypothetical protein DCQ26_04940 [Marinilabiliales bacterium]|nr:MAG: hypothetical protein A2W95_04805 [Bacteroidetes bacterium GWA2_40_14]OFZ28224.1 MAG: hypothetical protein A2437_04945 [Bacteroidetes bacterium RIFOXYC2_FULL_40_12]HAM97935.1 hypothetical protein [Marinilabiliales bacterium]HAZ00832.1 hypothetical protein [Marinilabiliales bacterium]HBO73071.1 hypothetical protein [Marinilabiliales bacterium]
MVKEFKLHMQRAANKKYLCAAVSIAVEKLKSRGRDKVDKKDNFTLIKIERDVDFNSFNILIQ